MTLSRRNALSLGAGIPLAGLLAATGGLALSRPVEAATDALQQAHTAAGRARAAYHLVLESGKLPALSLELAERIYARHRANEETLGSRVGRGAVSLDRPDVQSALARAETPADMLRLMRDIEVQALATYLSQRSSDGEENVLLVAAAADGAMHWTLLNHILGEPLPAEGLAAGGSLPMTGAL